jgi:multidrug transporter EmrE-like cation transporter
LSRDSDVTISPRTESEGGRTDHPWRTRLSAANLALLLFAVASAACGQILLKHGMSSAALRAESGHRSLAVSAATSPFVWLGLTIFGVSALAWMTTLSRVPLSIAYPFNALGFLGILTASALILHERTSPWTWVGTLMVVAGLIVVVSTRPS